MDNDFNTNEEYQNNFDTNENYQSVNQEYDQNMNNNNNNNNYQDAYNETGFKKYINQFRSSKFFIPTIAILLLLLLIVIIVSIYSSSTGKLKSININSPKIIYLGEKQDISAVAKGSGNLSKTLFHFDTSNRSIVEIESKAGKTGKKVKNKLIPITTGRFLLYVKAELKDQKIDQIQQEVVICKKFNQDAIQRKNVLVVAGYKTKTSLFLGKDKECYENIVYSIEDDSIATVDKEGNISGLKSGQTKLTIYQDKEKVELEVKVIESSKKVAVTGITVNNNKLTLQTKETKTITANVLPQNATNKLVKWTSSNDSIAAVDNNGNITGVGKGQAIITVTTAEGEFQQEITVTVNSGTSTKDNDNKNIPIKSISFGKKTTSILTGDTEDLAVTINPSNATNKSITYKSSNTNIATVSASGVVTAKSVGRTTITATSKNNKKATIIVNVVKKQTPVESVSITPSRGEIYVGDTITLKEVIKPSDATDQNVTWASSNTSVATVSNGVVKGIKAGNTTIIVKTENNKTSTAAITVKARPVVDKTAPVISTAKIYSNNDNKKLAVAGNTITLEVTFNENLGTKPSININGSAVTVTGSNKSFKATYKVSSQGTSDKTVPFEIYNYKDAAGNTGVKVTKTTDGSYVTIKAKQQPVKTTTFTIKYDKGLGTGSMANQTITYGKPTNLTKNGGKIKRNGYDFVGWVVKGDNGYYGCKGNKVCTTSTASYDGYQNLNDVTSYNVYKDGTSVQKTTQPGKTVNFTAAWVKLYNVSTSCTSSKCTIKYTLSPEQKTAWSMQYSTDGKTYKEMAKELIKNKTSDKDISGSFDINRTEKDRTIYIRACLHQIPDVCTTVQKQTIPNTIYKIIYDNNGGSGSMKEQYIEYGVDTNLTANAFSNSSYTFLGWVAYRPQYKSYLGYTSTDTNKSTGWQEQSKLKLYWVYRNKVSVAKTANPGETVNMYAQWAKISGSVTNCTSQRCDISGKISVAGNIKGGTYWDIYATNKNGSWVKQSDAKEGINRLINIGKNEVSYKIINFDRQSTARTVQVKACLNQSGGSASNYICTQSISVKLNAKSSSGSGSGNGGGNSGGNGGGNKPSSDGRIWSTLKDGYLCFDMGKAEGNSGGSKPCQSFSNGKYTLPSLIKIHYALSGYEQIGWKIYGKNYGYFGCSTVGKHCKSSNLMYGNPSTYAIYNSGYSGSADSNAAVRAEAVWIKIAITPTNKCTTDKFNRTYCTMNIQVRSNTNKIYADIYENSGHHKEAIIASNYNNQFYYYSFTSSKKYSISDYRMYGDDDASHTIGEYFTIWFYINGRGSVKYEFRDLPVYYNYKKIY